MKTMLLPLLFGSHVALALPDGFTRLDSSYLTPDGSPSPAPSFLLPPAATPSLESSESWHWRNGPYSVSSQVGEYDRYLRRRLDARWESPEAWGGGRFYANLTWQKDFAAGNTIEAQRGHSGPELRQLELGYRFHLTENLSVGPTIGVRSGGASPSRSDGVEGFLGFGLNWSF